MCICVNKYFFFIKTTLFVLSPTFVVLFLISLSDSSPVIKCVTPLPSKRLFHSKLVSVLPSLSPFVLPKFPSHEVSLPSHWYLSLPSRFSHLSTLLQSLLRLLVYPSRNTYLPETPSVTLKLVSPLYDTELYICQCDRRHTFYLTYPVCTSS